MSLPALTPRTLLKIDITNLTDSELRALVAEDLRLHSPPWIYVFCIFWLLTMLALVISNLLPTHRRLSYFLTPPDRFFRWVPGKEKFDREWEVEEGRKREMEIREERQRRERQRRERQRRTFAEFQAKAPVRVGGERVGGNVDGREGDWKMLTPRERVFPSRFA